MPKIVKIEKLKVYLNENSNTILDCFKRNMEKLNVEATILNQADSHKRGGGIGFALGCWEVISNGAHNAKWIVLDGEDIELDDNVYTLFDTYRAHLNDILKKMDKEAHEVKKGETASRFVLLHALILRTLACALRVKANDADYGQKLLNVFDNFILDINKSQVLLLDDKLSEFEIELVSLEHKNWMGVLREAVDAMKIMHLPKTAISQISCYLEDLKHAIAAHILVTAEYRFNDDDISVEYTRNTLRDFERSVVSGIVDNWDAITIQAVHLKIIGQMNDPILKARIQSLYDSFVNTNLLLSMSTQLNTLVNGTSWILILSNYVNISGLVDVVRFHSDKCNQHLSIDKTELSRHKKNKGYQQLIKYNLLGKCFSASYVCNTLSLLKVPKVVEKFLKQMEHSMAQLDAINARIQVCFNRSIINKDCMDISNLRLVRQNNEKTNQDVAAPNTPRISLSEPTKEASTVALVNVKESKESLFEKGKNAFKKKKHKEKKHKENEYSPVNNAVHLFKPDEISESSVGYMEKEETSATEIPLKERKVIKEVKKVKEVKVEEIKEPKKEKQIKAETIEIPSIKNVPVPGSVATTGLFGITAQSNVIPHNKLMLIFMQHLGVEYDAIYSGIAVEQTLVAMAGLNIRQTGAVFRRDENQHTFFILRLNDQQVVLFKDFYDKKFPGLILKVEQQGPANVKITMDTQILAEKVSIELGIYQNQESNEDMNKCAIM